MPAAARPAAGPPGPRSPGVVRLASSSIGDHQTHGLDLLVRSGDPPQVPSGSTSRSRGGQPEWPRDHRRRPDRRHVAPVGRIPPLSGVIGLLDRDIPCRPDPGAPGRRPVEGGAGSIPAGRRPGRIAGPARREGDRPGAEVARGRGGDGRDHGRRRLGPGAIPQAHDPDQLSPGRLEGGGFSSRLGARRTEEQRPARSGIGPASHRGRRGPGVPTTGILGDLRRPCS